MKSPRCQLTSCTETCLFLWLFMNIFKLSIQKSHRYTLMPFYLDIKFTQFIIINGKTFASFFFWANYNSNHRARNTFCVCKVLHFYLTLRLQNTPMTIKLNIKKVCHIGIPIVSFSNCYVSPYKTRKDIDLSLKINFWFQKFLNKQFSIKSGSKTFKERLE